MASYTSLCIVLAAIHFVLVYILAVVVKVSYATMWIISSLATAFVASYVRRMTPFWHDTLAKVQRTGDIRHFTLDVLGGLIALMAGGVASAVVIYRTYGLGATLFTAGTGAAVATIV